MLLLWKVRGFALAGAFEMWPMKAPAPRRSPETERSCGPARHRRWPRTFPGICFVALVAGWAGPLATSAAGAPPATHGAPVVAASFLSRALQGPLSPGTGTMEVFPTAVPAAAVGEALEFTYTATDQGLSYGYITLTVPQGWTPPSLVGQGAIKVACVTPASDCNADHAPVTLNGQVVTVNRIILPLEQSLTITYSDATVPGSAGPATFSASEEPTTKGPLTPVNPSPVVTVTCSDGTGTETVSPARWLPPAPARLSSPTRRPAGAR